MRRIRGRMSAVTRAGERVVEEWEGEVAEGVGDGR